MSNIGLSLAEDGVVAGMVALALAYPLVAGIVATVFALASIAVTGESTWTVTPSDSSWRRALSLSDGGNVASRRGPASTRCTSAALGRARRNSRGSVWRAISASVPASSTPVGPPPITTKRNHCRRRSPSASRSAASNARSTRARIASASSSVFRPGACTAQSSWPKYACVEPVATTR